MISWMVSSCIHRAFRDPGAPAWFHARVQAGLVSEALDGHQVWFERVVMGLLLAGMILLLASGGLRLLAAMVLIIGVMLALMVVGFMKVLDLKSVFREIYQDAVQKVEARLTHHERMMYADHLCRTGLGPEHSLVLGDRPQEGA